MDGSVQTPVIISRAENRTNVVDSSNRSVVPGIQQASNRQESPPQSGKSQKLGQSSSNCLKVVGIIEQVIDSDWIKVKITTEPYLDRRVKCLLSDSSVPAIAYKTKLNLGLKEIFKPQKRLIVLWATVFEYTEITSSDVWKALGSLVKNTPHETIIDKFYFSWRPFFIMILIHANKLRDKTIEKVLSKFLPSEQEPLLYGNRDHQLRFITLLKLFDSKESTFLARLGGNHTCNMQYVKHLVKLIVYVTKNLKSVRHLLRSCFLGNSEDLLELLDSCYEGNDVSAQSLADLSFREIPLIPVMEELAGIITSLTGNSSENIITQNLLQLELHLVPNRVDSPWDSATEFLDTHFRLLREECFASIRDRIASVRLGLNDHLRLVHRNVRIIGYAISEGSIVAKIKFRAHKSRVNLMFGNLICIDSDTSFSNPIWATVQFSDMKSSEIAITLLGVENRSANVLVSAFQRLISFRDGVMIESPTYYHAFRPVLSRLQNLNESEFPFALEILVTSTEPQPSPILFHNPEFQIDSQMDESQKHAVQTSLENRFSLIQGPPGCGKTFVGKEIVKLMLKFKNFDGPILVMTYKNRALDGILEGCLEFTTSLVRIGGKSTSEKVSEFNLHNLYAEARKHHPAEEYNKLLEANSELQKVQEELEVAAKELSGVFTATNLLEFLQQGGINEQQQLRSLLSKNFAKNYGKLIKQNQLMYLSFEDVNKAVSDILNGKKETAAKLLNHALRNWLSESELTKFLPSPLFISTMNVPRAKSKKTVEDDELDDEEWEEVFAERFVGFESRLTFVNVSERPYKLYPKLQKCLINLEPDFREKDVREISDVWSLTSQGRYILLSNWFRKWREEKDNYLTNALDNYSQFYKQVKSLEEGRNLNFLRSKDMVGCTITGCCLRMELISRLAPSVVIIEEAAEILESQLVAALPSSVKHLVLIGDHRQLPPQVHHYRLAKKFNLKVSIFERLANIGYPISQLQYHRRGPRSLTPLFSRFYKQRIVPAKPDPKLPKVLRNLGLMYWWTHDAPAQNSSNGTSFENEFEAIMIVGVVKLLTQLGDIKAEKISIITGYMGQATKIKQLLAKDQIEGITVCTVDRYQGDENEYIFLSLTRSASEDFESKKPSLGFLGSENRACVALSRAKLGLYIFGCSSLFQTHPAWKEAVKYFQINGKLGHELRFVIFGKVVTFDHPDDFAKLFKRLKLETEQMKLKIQKQLTEMIPAKARNGIHDVTAQYGKKIENSMNKSILDLKDLGMGRDANNIPYKGFKVIKVRQIFDKNAYLLYLHHMQAIEKNNPPLLGRNVDCADDWMDEMKLNKKANEVLLFHGTKSLEIAEIIAKSGFDERVSSLGGMYGAGIYFAENADKSDHYTQPPIHTMFLARVLLGNPFKTTVAADNHNPMRRPPPINNKKPFKLHDSVIAVSRRKGYAGASNHRHQEFIIFDRYQCLPEFLIEYKHIL